MMAARTVELTVKPVLDAVTVRPGDTLVVRVATDLSMDQVAEFKSRLTDRLPGVDTLVVCADQLLVYRPDGSEG